jgi:hypothetical protein
VVIASDAKGDALHQDEDETGRYARFEDETVGYAAGIRRALHHCESAGDKLQGGEDDHDTARDEKEDDADKVDPCPVLVIETLVENVNPDVAVFEEGGTCAHEEDKGEKVPLKFLGEDETGVEDVSHDHVYENHYHDDGRSPGNDAPDPFVQGVDPLAKLA